MKARDLTLLLLTGALACGQETPPPEPGDAPPTYNQHIAPLLERECASCHTTNGHAPFPLETYEDAAPRAAAIARATHTRTMPPFGVDNSGACNTYRDARWLTEAEITTLARWAESGTPRGEGNPLKPGRVATPRPVIPTMTIDIGAPYTPDRSRPDDYRCFVVDLDVPENSYLTGFIVRPGTRSIVHHIILYALAGSEAEATVEALDAAEDGPGYTCFGGPRTDDIRFLAGWAPGTTETIYPQGTGIEIPAHRRAVMQIHYHAGEEPLSDRTALDLEVTNEVEHQAIVLPLADLQLELQPGLTRATAQASATLDDPPAVDVYGVFPHMHLLGRTMRVDHHRADTTGCLVDVPNWRFDWQQFYFYDRPLRVEVGDRVNLTCTFDTTTRAGVVKWGEGTSDEMCLAGFYVVRRDPA